MRRLFIILIFFISIPLIEGAGFSPSSLTFNLKPGNTQCGTINIYSDSNKIYVSDSWASKDFKEWDIQNFTENSSFFDLTLSYNKELSPNEREIEVCISGENEGEYHGAIIFRQEKTGDSIIQLAVWLKAAIYNKSKEERNGQSSSSLSDASTPPINTKEKLIVAETISNNSLNHLQNSQPNNNSKSIEESSLTGFAISDPDKKIIEPALLIILSVILIILLIASLISGNKK